MALYMMHTSAATGVRAMSEARARGVPIYGETLHQYLLYSAEDYKRPNGQMFHTYPSLKFAEDHAALWRRPGTARSRPWRPMRSAARCASRCKAAASTTPPRQRWRRAAPLAHVHRDRAEARPQLE